jgi:sugar phosphate isomerase/epimerase
MNLSLSCCWNSHRHDDGYEMLKEIARLGFSHAELSHGVRIPLVAGILRAVDEGMIRISSVHNFCPLPMGVNFAAPNIYQPTASGRQERSMWHRNTLKTIDFAERVGAPLMVIHSGSVRFLLSRPGDKLEGLRKREILGQEPSEATLAAYERLKEKTLRKLRRKRTAAIERLVEAYQSLLPAAKEKGVRLGIENREGIEELPLDTEMKDLLERLGEPEWFGYWHDAGHAELKHRLGLLDHETMLRENSARQFGFHLHDVSRSDRDHRPLGTGVIDWPMVRRYMRPDHCFVLELSPRLTVEEVLASKSFAENALLADLG